MGCAIDNHQDHSLKHNHHTHGHLYDDDHNQVMCPTEYKTRGGQTSKAAPTPTSCFTSAKK